jgi:hypothetical protein
LVYGTYYEETTIWRVIPGEISAGILVVVPGVSVYGFFYMPEIRASGFVYDFQDRSSGKMHEVLSRIAV